MADGDRDRVREATDIVDLIGEVTKVRKSGRSFMAVCPFHEEKTPSMSVDRARGLYHCFGCGEGGDVFTFIQKTQGIGFGEALDLLAKRAGITLTLDPQAARRSGRRSEAVEAIRVAIGFYHDRLKSSPEAGPARAYLRGRGYDGALIEEWDIGFAGTDWDSLTKTLRSQGVSDQAALDAGLSRRGNRGSYDVFRGRLMFPIHDVRGDPVGFGGRKVEGVSREVTNNPDAKYINSADSLVYHKSNLLFGLDRARPAIVDDGQAVIVEGYTDVIAMHIAGVKTAVATCGTALGDGHFDLLRRFTEKVVLAFDSDRAGSNAAMRSDDLESPFRLDLDLRMALMPDGLDPADLVQEGRGGELAKAVAEARPLLEQRILQEVNRFDLNGPEGRARALHAAVGLLRRVGDEIGRQEYARFAAKTIGLDLDTVTKAVASGKVEGQVAAPKVDRGPPNRIETELLRVVLAEPRAAAEVTVDDFSDQRMRLVYLAAQEVRQVGVEFDPSLIEDAEVQALARSLVLDSRPLPESSDVVNLLKIRRVDARIDALEAEIGRLDEGSQPYSDALRELIGLQQQKRSLGSQ